MAAASSQLQLFLPDSGAYSEERSLLHRVVAGEWRDREFRLTNEITEGRLRLDPADTPSVIEISELAVTTADQNEPLWSLSGSSGGSWELSGTAVGIPRREGITIISYGSDPQLLLPPIPGLCSGTVVRLRLRVSTGIVDIENIIRQALAEQVPLQTGNLHALRSELDDLREHHKHLTDELRLDHLQLDLLRCDMGAVVAENLELKAALESARKYRTRVRKAGARLYASLLHLSSWRLAPVFRFVAGLYRGR